MSNQQITLCKCPLDCQEFCYILRQKREREEAEIQRFIPPYIQEIAKNIKAQETQRQSQQPPQTSTSPIHPLHIAWAFVIMLAIVFNQQLFAGIATLSKLAK